MNLKTTLTFLFFSLLVFSFLVSNSVKAQSYYNHILNPSFIPYSNYCEDGTFESGSFDSGVTYGNWSSIVGGSVSSAIPHTGVYSLYIHGDNPVRQVKYNITYGDGLVLGADIVNFTFWCYNYYLPDDFQIYIYYSDASSDSDSFSLTGSWVQHEFESLINDAKYVDYFIIQDTDTDASDTYFDNFILTVDDGGGQDDITMNTTPWKLGGTYTNNFGYINTVQGYIDTSSVQMSGYDSYLLIQDMDYVDSDNVQYANCFVKAADVADGVGVTCSLVYSDRTTSERTKYVTGDGSTWEELNFGQSWILENKYIIQIRFNFESDSGTHVGFIMDDVGFWVSYPLGFSRFVFDISPNPIAKTSFDFSAYQDTTYTFLGYVYNVTSEELNENGTYSFTDNFGLRSGNVVNGQFSLQLNQRSFTGDGVLENIGITITLPESNEVLGVTISAYWYQTGLDDDTAEDTAYEERANFLLIYILIFIPPLLFSYVMHCAMSGNPNSGGFVVVSFCCGLGLTSYIGWISNIVSMGFFAFCVFVIVVLFLMIIRGTFSRGG